MKPIILIAALLSGCTVTHWEVESAQKSCEDKGGLSHMTVGIGGTRAYCRDKSGWSIS